MIPPFFAAVNVPSVRALLVDADGVLRVWGFGEAPEKETRPYVVWQTISGGPFNFINQTPNSDSWLVQVDVYVEAEQGQERNAASSLLTIAQTLRDALEPVAYIDAWRGMSREPGTRYYRYSFDVSFITDR